MLAAFIFFSLPKVKIEAVNEKILDKSDYSYD